MNPRERTLFDNEPNKPAICKYSSICSTAKLPEEDRTELYFEVCTASESVRELSCIRYNEFKKGEMK